MRKERARVREEKMREEERGEGGLKKEGNVICTEFDQFAGSTPQRRDVRGGRGVLMSMLVGDTGLFRCGCTPSVVLFSLYNIMSLKKQQQMYV